MKKLFILLIISGLGFIFIQAKSSPEFLSRGQSDNVREVLKTSCYDCHSDASKNKKAMAALNFDSWDSYKESKKVSKLADICKLVEDDKMPPEKYLEHNPAAKMDNASKKLVCEWAEKETEKILTGQQ